MKANNYITQYQSAEAFERKLKYFLYKLKGIWFIHDSISIINEDDFNESYTNIINSKEFVEADIDVKQIIYSLKFI